MVTEIPIVQLFLCNRAGFCSIRENNRASLYFGAGQTRPDIIPGQIMYFVNLRKFIHASRTYAPVSRAWETALL